MDAAFKQQPSCVVTSMYAILFEMQNHSVCSRPRAILQQAFMHTWQQTHILLQSFKQRSTRRGSRHRRLQSHRDQHSRSVMTSRLLQNSTACVSARVTSVPLLSLPVLAKMHTVYHCFISLTQKPILLM